MKKNFHEVKNAEKFMYKGKEYKKISYYLVLDNEGEKVDVIELCKMRNEPIACTVLV